MSAINKLCQAVLPRFCVIALVGATAAGCGGGGGGDSGDGTLSVSGVALSSATPKYSQSLLVTVTGSALDRGLGLSSSACSNAVLQTTAPYISGSSTAYFRCTVSSVGPARIDVTAAGSALSLAGIDFTVPTPQVTLTLEGGAVSGDMVLTLDPAKAPITVNNFLAYVNAGFYVGTAMHRIVPGFVVQGGGFQVINGALVAKPTNPPIELEEPADTGLSNRQWTIAMARLPQADSATAQFFINLADNSALDIQDGGYAVFGLVSQGTQVALDLSQAPCGAPIAGVPGCSPNPAVLITAALQTR